LDYFTAVISEKLYQSLIDEYERTPESCRFKTYNHHWWNGLDMFCKEKFNAAMVYGFEKKVFFDNEKEYLLFMLKYGDQVVQD